MHWKDLTEDVAKELGIPKGDVERAYNLYWKSLRETIEENDFTSHFLSKEEFDKTNHKFHVRNIGRIYLTYPRYCFIWDMLHPEEEEPKYIGPIDNSVIMRRGGTFMTNNGRNHKKWIEQHGHQDKND